MYFGSCQNCVSFTRHETCVKAINSVDYTLTFTVLVIVFFINKLLKWAVAALKLVYLWHVLQVLCHLMDLNVWKAMYKAAEYCFR